MKELIREFIKTLILSEAAATADEAAANGYALFIDRNKKIYIYDPNKLKKMFKYALNDEQFRQFMPHIDFDQFDNFFMGFNFTIGMIELESTPAPCYGAMEVKYSAARNPYGPLMYNIALSISPTHTIISDRMHVSDKAENVWKYFYMNRGDVQKLPMDDIDDPKTPPKYDDCKLNKDAQQSGKTFINTAYRVFTNKPDVSKLKQNHSECIEEITELMVTMSYEQSAETANNIEQVISSGAGYFFNQAYNND